MEADRAETCDTSVLVPAVVSWHPAHAECRKALTDVTVIPGHVLLETYSVLTRLPAPHRLGPKDAADLLTGLPFSALALPARRLVRLFPDVLGRHQIRGGATYDALVAATALHHGHRLISRDHRARGTYEAVGVTVRYL